MRVSWTSDASLIDSHGTLGLQSTNVSDSKVTWLAPATTTPPLSMMVVKLTRVGAMLLKRIALEQRVKTAPSICS